MSRMLKIVREHVIPLTVICFVLGLALAAWAVPPEEVRQDTGTFNFVGPCCFSFNETVTVTEPAKPVAVVVMSEFGGVISVNGSAVIGLMVNGGPCTLYGSGFIPNRQINAPRRFQSVIFPGDGLRAGTNTFTLCGGSVFGNAALLIGEFTLSARLSN